MDTNAFVGGFGFHAFFTISAQTIEMEASASKDAEAAQLLQLLVQLRVSDPILYQETIKTLGMEELGKALEQQLPDQAQGASPGQTALETVSQLTEAVSKMREGSDMDLKVGQQPKVRHASHRPSALIVLNPLSGEGHSHHTGAKLLL